ncbi:hypothetical protein [Legionella fallonii]|uniref:Uncharacterized protein n=1 Tax=Legionella fallonii LLAP-10 TaxID=1212491 RepID=A0A098GBF2_9GAMM|nr:hypothetical protein [Legionella fallonii]CEG59312.1 conserved protein of unknown function [Legionella fallonii LLAP-10]
MDVSVKEFLIMVYIVGGLIALCYSIHGFLSFQHLKKYYNNDLLLKRPDIRRYLILKPLLWPYFFVIEKSPIERFSELFFKHYGDEGHTYFRSQGLKNFLNDLFKGKNRYKKHQIHTLCWPIDKNSQDWIEHKQFFKGNNFYAHIVYIKMQDEYLVRVSWEKERTPHPVDSISRFELDQGQRLSASEFKTRMQQINVNEANKLHLEIK